MWTIHSCKAKNCKWMILLKRNSMHILIWNWVIKTKLGNHTLFAKNCVEILCQWTKRTTKMRFEIPLIWCEPRNHVDDCYFCITLAYGLCLKPKLMFEAKHTIQYPNSDLAILQVPLLTEISESIFIINNWDDWTFPLVTEAHDVIDCDLLDISEISTSSSTSTVPQPQNQSELNYLMRDLTLSKISVKILSFRLNEKHILHPSTCITYHRQREEE